MPDDVVTPSQISKLLSDIGLEEEVDESETATVCCKLSFGFNFVVARNQAMLFSACLERFLLCRHRSKHSLMKI